MATSLNGRRLDKLGERLTKLEAATAALSAELLELLDELHRRNPSAPQLTPIQGGLR